MTERKRRAAQKYLRSLLPQLGLDLWEIDVMPEPLEEDGLALASVVKHYGRKAAAVWFRSDFFEYTPEYQRHIAIHELLHCCFAGDECYVFDTLDKTLPEKTHAPIAAAYRLLHEYSIDGLSVALAPFFPLPNFP